MGAWTVVPVCLIITASSALAQRDIWDPAVNKVSTRHELSFVYHKFHKSAKRIIVFKCKCFIVNIIKILISRGKNTFDMHMYKKNFVPKCVSYHNCWINTNLQLLFYYFLVLNSYCIKRFYTFDNIYFFFFNAPILLAWKSPLAKIKKTS